MNVKEIRTANNQWTISGTLGTHGRRQTHTLQKTKNELSNTDPTRKLEVNPCARDRKAVPASYKTGARVIQ